MKNLFGVLFVLIFTACGSGSADKAFSDSSMAAPADTTNAVTPRFPDSAKLLRDTNHISGDTSGGRDSSKN